MGLQDVGPQGTHARTDLVEPTEPVVARVVWDGRPPDTNHPSASFPRGDVGAVPGIFIPRARRDHCVVVTALAQKVTSGRQMASNPSTPFRIEFGDVDDLHAGVPSSAAALTGRAKIFRASCPRRMRASRSNGRRICRPLPRSPPGRVGRFASRSSATSRAYRTPTVQSFRHGSCIKNYDGVVTTSQSSAPTIPMAAPRSWLPAPSSSRAYR